MMVAAGLHQNGFWQYAQKLASLSRAVCDGDPARVQPVAGTSSSCKIFR